MEIKSFGCSFIFGTDLKDNPENVILHDPVGRFSRLTWPALLAKKLGYDYNCYARPGSGNLQIAERTLNECSPDSKSFFIIDWTWIDRFDYIKSLDPWQPWGTLVPNQNNNIADQYYRYLHTEYKDKLCSLIYIKNVIDTLMQNKIEFLMTYEDALLFDQKWHTSPAIITLQEYIKPYMMTFEGKTFLDWSREKSFPESSGWHPLETAHRAATEYIFEHKFAKKEPL